MALLALCAALPVRLLVHRPGPGWLAAVGAPLLGLLGLAGAFPALAGQAAGWRMRAALGALGYWWLRLAESLVDEPGRRLWLGAPAGAGARLVWESSPTSAATHALAPLFTLGLLAGALLWAAAAALLPVLVRGRSAMQDTLAAIVWAVALAVATPLVLTGLAAGNGTRETTPRGVLLGAACGAVLAVGACALRGREDLDVGEYGNGGGWTGGWRVG